MQNDIEEIPFNWKRINKEVYSANSNIISTDFAEINRLKKEVLSTPYNRIRLCAHQNADDLLHEMLIVIAQGSYVRPHKHINKSESFHIIEGMLDVIIFNDNGDIIEIIPMGKPSSGRKFFYRLSMSWFHTLVLRTKVVVFHETTNGPFIKENTICAPWSPEPGDPIQENKFMKELEAKIEFYMLGK